MKNEFFKAKDWVQHNLAYDKNTFVSFFETTIRDLGGLLSAFYLSGEKVFLEKANELGSRLTKAFGNRQLPLGLVNLVTGISKPLNWARGKTLLAEIGTFQLEFRALSEISGNPMFSKKATEAIEFVQNHVQNKDGLFPMYLDAYTGQSDRKEISVGPVGDSFYEYLLKVFVQGGHGKENFKTWYRKSANGILKHLMYKSQPTGLRYLRDLEIGVGYNDKISHLFCFTPGMFALGSYHNNDNPELKNQDLLVAKQLMYTCYQFYERSASGLSPEYIHLHQAKHRKGELSVSPNDDDYNLRPETVESLYILYQVTKHPIYRLWGKKIVENLEKHSKTSFGYGSVRGVFSGNTNVLDSQESFFFAETLKYLYLLFDDNPVVNLDEWVFNTEGHPLRRFDT
eukprot:snap_masked-scaffold_8-processed-gene-0.13-mRNA-1 protein AED:0.35 eAED:0.35 QI:0/0/0/1/1/1/4/0/397